MKNFLKIVFGSCLGVIVAFGALIFIGGAIGSSLASQADQVKEVKANSVLHLTFDELIPEQTGNTEINFSEFDAEKKLGLHDIVQTITAAKTDDRIKGIYLDAVNVPVGRASATQIREAVEDFKSEGKFVIAYSKYYAQGAYYLASAADQVIINPMGGIEFRGYGAVLSFFAEMLDEVGIKMEVLKVGKFKGAVEPFVRNSLSKENRDQISEYLDGLWDQAKEDIGNSRGKTPEEIQAIAEAFSANNAEGAIESGLADMIGYEDEAFAEMRTRMGLESDDKLNFISPQTYFPSAKKKKDYSVKDKVAVVFAEGQIVDGEGEQAQIGDEKYVKVIRKLRKDKNVKAIVMRVNSGGGSAMASENIWRELQLCREAGKPVVASMSDVAASGGYYIACASDSIFAEPNTITGSIGVFGLFPIVTELMDETLHINFDSVRTAKYAASFTPLYEMTSEEKAIMQNQTNKVYDIFLQRVVESRKAYLPDTAAVHKVAQGRVWTGEKALEIGLIDRYGGLEDAIGSAASLAGLDTYRMVEYPKQKDPFVKLMEEFTGQTTSFAQTMVKSELGEYHKYYEQLKMMQQMEGVQAIMPFNMEIR